MLFYAVIVLKLLLVKGKNDQRGEYKVMNIQIKLKELLQNSEMELLEFKEAKSNYDLKKLGKYFGALSNEANLLGKNEAWLIFGVKDNKNIVGTNYRADAQSLQALKNEIANKTSSRITFKEIYEVAVEDKRVILFEIPPAPLGLPVSFDGHYYYRGKTYQSRR